LIALANHIEGATAKSAPEWIEIPLGNHDHAQGMQVLDAESGAKLLSNFNSLKESKGAKFKGLPVYFGHPDDPALAARYPDKRSRGWIRQMEVSNEALRLHVDWTPLGRREVEDEEVAFVSPRWGVQKIANTTRNVRPTSLISVGLVNEPNLRDVAPLINEGGGSTLPPWIHLIAGTEPTASEDEVKAALQKKADDAGKIEEVRRTRDEYKAASDRHQKAHEDLQAALSNSKAEADQALGNEKARADAAELALSNERKARIGLIVGGLITGGRITKAEEAGVIEQLSNAGDGFDALVTTLSNKAPVIHTGASQTANLGSRRNKVDDAQEGESTRQSTVIRLVNERMAETGEEYSVAFNNVRQANAVLFDAMKKPAAASK
jgi:hypothetical protein